jgi:hypothetical protein
MVVALSRTSRTQPSLNKMFNQNPIKMKIQCIIKIQVSVPPCLPCAARIDPFSCFRWNGSVGDSMFLRQFCTPNKLTECPKAPTQHLTLFSPTPSHLAKPQGWGGGGFRGGVKPCCNICIADNASSMPWKRELLCPFLSFCPIVTQNPTLAHSVSVPPWQ